MTAYTTQPGGLFQGALSPLKAGLNIGGNVGAGSAAGVTAVYPYSPPNDGQTWPRPY